MNFLVNKSDQLSRDSV